MPAQAELHGRRPTITDVARLAGTSRGTVSFVVNGRPGVAPATRERVLAAMAELQWTPSRPARALSHRRADAVGLVLAREPRALGSDTFFAPFIGGLESALQRTGQSLVLRFVAGDEAERRTYEELVSQRQVDGFVLSDLRHDDPRVGLVAGLGAQAVTLDRPDLASPFPSVSRADEPGVTAAVDHLIAHGHERIAHVGGPARYVHATRRREVWQRAMRRHGLPADRHVEADFTAAGGAMATSRLLALGDGERPTAILFDNDLMAASGVAVAQRLGFDVPGRLSVVGYDDAEISAYLNPPLTSVRTDPFSWGRIAGRLVLELLANGSASSQEMSASELVVRASSGPAPAAV
ncbi:LacI family DNA-binding transcriptional regulator [Luteimicrobium xylanilyticum]|uniref:HTH-type transcriptional regulator GalR n=1 Tax=Luteimicrobium xylanilyticum TaxID=1133546 RepID=A0A5P9Q8U0_9MICO|nr:LacI family DNA-binding transcriptional regulator [Luteimicrobium xylanilyticum]QFU97472.1 HTH-type transcriptional regulator GalR [Luteimicrobium xylanilyticum]